MTRNYNPPPLSNNRAGRPMSNASGQEQEGVELDADCPRCGVALLLEREGTDIDTDPDKGRCPECDSVFPIIY